MFGQFDFGLVLVLLESSVEKALEGDGRGLAHIKSGEKYTGKNKGVASVEQDERWMSCGRRWSESTCTALQSLSIRIVAEENFRRRKARKDLIAEALAEALGDCL